MRHPKRVAARTAYRNAHARMNLTYGLCFLAGLVQTGAGMVGLVCLYYLLGGEDATKKITQTFSQAGSTVFVPSTIPGSIPGTIIGVLGLGVIAGLVYYALKLLRPSFLFRAFHRHEPTFSRIMWDHHVHFGSWAMAKKQLGDVLDHFKAVRAWHVSAGGLVLQDSFLRGLWAGLVLFFAPKLGLFFLGVWGSALLLLGLAAGAGRRKARVRLHRKNQVNLLLENLAALRGHARTMGLVANLMHQYRLVNVRQRMLQAELWWLDGLVAFSLRVLRLGLIGLCLVVSSGLWVETFAGLTGTNLSGPLELAGFVCVLLIAVGFLDPHDAFVRGLNRRRAGKMAHEALGRSLSNQRPRALGTKPPDQAFRGVLFMAGAAVIPPDTTEPVLQSVDLRLFAGHTVGALGESGSGKTALARLLAGVWNDYDGDFTIDDLPFRDYDKELYSRYVGYVPQEDFFPAGTVAETLGGFHPDISNERMVATLRLCGLEAAIAGLPHGVSTFVERGGLSLPFALRRRLTFARAVFHNPKILVIDTLTGFDEEGMSATLEALKALKKRGQTSIFIVVHDKSLLGLCNELLVLHRGQSVLGGPAEQVLEELKTSMEATRTSRATPRPQPSAVQTTRQPRPASDPQNTMETGPSLPQEGGRRTPNNGTEPSRPQASTAPQKTGRDTGETQKAPGKNTEKNAGRNAGRVSPPTS